MTHSPNGLSCGVIQDNVYLFCECVSVREAWFWIRQRLLSLLPPEAVRTSNFEMLHVCAERVGRGGRVVVEHLCEAGLEHCNLQEIFTIL